jgi:hypothetical protein
MWLSYRNRREFVLVFLRMIDTEDPLANWTGSRWSRWSFLILLSGVSCYRRAEKPKNRIHCFLTPYCKFLIKSS